MARASASITVVRAAAMPQLATAHKQPELDSLWGCVQCGASVPFHALACLPTAGEADRSEAAAAGRAAVATAPVTAAATAASAAAAATPSSPASRTTGSVSACRSAWPPCIAMAA